MESDNTKAEYVTYEDIHKWASDNIKTQYAALPPEANMSFRSLTEEESIKILPREIKISTSSLLLGHGEPNEETDMDSKVYAHICGKHWTDVKFSCGNKVFTQVSLGGITLVEPFCNLVGSVGNAGPLRNLKTLVIFYFLVSGHLEKYVQTVPYLPEFKTACTSAWKGRKAKNTKNIMLDKGESTGFGEFQNASNDLEDDIETELAETTSLNRKIRDEPRKESQGNNIIFDNGIAIGYVELRGSSANLENGVNIQSTAVPKDMPLKRKRQDESIIDLNRSSPPEQKPKDENQLKPPFTIESLVAEYRQFQADKDALKAERDKLDQEIRTFATQSESLEYKKFQSDRDALTVEREKLAREIHNFKVQSESLTQNKEDSEQNERNLQSQIERLCKQDSQLQMENNLLKPRNVELEHVKRKLQSDIEESRKQENKLQSQVNFLEPRNAELELERSKLQLELARLGRGKSTE